MSWTKEEVKKKLMDSGLYLVIVLISIGFIYFGNQYAVKDLVTFQSEFSLDTFDAKVEAIVDKTPETFYVDEESTVEGSRITFMAKALSGAHKGEALTGIQILGDPLQANPIPEVKIGDKVILIEDAADPNQWQLAEKVRTDYLILLAGAFGLVLLLFGRNKGFNTLLSLLFTCLALFTVFIPAILSGKNIYLFSVIVCVYTILMTFSLVNGLNKKSLAAIIGSFGGIIVSGVIVSLMSKVMALTGLVDEDSIYLLNLPLKTPIDLQGVIFAAIIIGAMGAIMDVSMSIASALWEIQEKTKKITFMELIKSGMNIGRDILGTMANTLILAYIGGSLSIVLLLTAYSTSLVYLMNTEMIIVEILQALVGSFGILLTIPLTAIASGLAFFKKKERKKWNSQL